MPRIIKCKGHPEWDTQVASLKWLRLNYLDAYNSVIKINNESKRSIIGRKMDKAAGLHAGASDLFIAYPTQQFHGLWLEIKPEGWKLTPSKKPHYDRQVAFIMKMRKMNYWGDMGIGIDECIFIMDKYLRGN